MIYLICVAIASVFWFLDALSKNYTTTITYPVRFDIPKDKVLVNPPPRYIKLNVNAYGFTLLRHKLRISFSPIVLDTKVFMNSSLKNNSGATHIRVATNRYIELFQSKFRSDVKVMGIEPDTLYFNFDQIVREKIPVTAELTFDFEKQFMQIAPVQLTPDSVWVKAPRSVLDTLKCIAIPPMHFKSVNKTITEEVSLPEQGNITIEAPQVVLTVPVEQYTEDRCEVPVEIINLPDSLSVKTFPSKVVISYLVALNQFQKVNTDNFLSVVDYNELNPGTQKVAVKIEKSPDNIISFKYQPHELEYLIEKN